MTDDELRGCIIGGTGEPIPDFLAEFAEDCGASDGPGFACQRDGVQITAGVSELGTDHPVLHVRWSVYPVSCTQRFRVETERLN